MRTIQTSQMSLTFQVCQPSYLVRNPSEIVHSLSPLQVAYSYCCPHGCLCFLHYYHHYVVDGYCLEHLVLHLQSLNLFVLFLTFCLALFSLDLCFICFLVLSLFCKRFIQHLCDDRISFTNQKHVLKFVIQHCRLFHDNLTD